MYILGFSGYHRDAPEAIIKDGEWIAAVEEKRLKSEKELCGVPTAAILAKRGCVWWVEATVEGIAEGTRQATTLDPETLQAIGHESAHIPPSKVWLEPHCGTPATDLRPDYWPRDCLVTKQKQRLRTDLKNEHSRP